MTNLNNKSKEDDLLFTVGNQIKNLAVPIRINDLEQYKGLSKFIKARIESDSEYLSQEIKEMLSVLADNDGNNIVLKTIVKLQSCMY